MADERFRKRLAELLQRDFGAPNTRGAVDTLEIPSLAENAPTAPLPRPRPTMDVPMPRARPTPMPRPRPAMDGDNPFGDAATPLDDSTDADNPFGDAATPIAEAPEGFLEENINRLGRGWNRLQQDAWTLGAETGLMDPASAAAAIAQEQRDLAQYPKSAEEIASDQEFAQADGWLESLGAVLRNPENLALGAIVESAPQSIPSTLGAAAGSVGGLGGASIGVGLGSGAVDAMSTMRDVMAENGVDMNDPASIEAGFNNPELMAKARRDAAERGISVGSWDALTTAIGGGLAGRAIRHLGKVGGTAAGGALEMGGGAAGEATAQLADKGQIESGKDVFIEAIAEGPGVITETGVAALSRRRQPGKEADDRVEPTVEASPAQTAPTRRVRVKEGFSRPAGEQLEVLEDDGQSATVRARTEDGTEMRIGRKAIEDMPATPAEPGGVLTNAPVEPEAQAAPAATKAAPPSGSSTPVTVAPAVRATLRAMGYPDEDIDGMSEAELEQEFKNATEDGVVVTPDAVVDAGNYRGVANVEQKGAGRAPAQQPNDDEATPAGSGQPAGAPDPVDGGAPPEAGPVVAEGAPPAGAEPATPELGAPAIEQPDRPAAPDGQGAGSVLVGQRGEGDQLPSVPAPGRGTRSRPVKVTSEADLEAARDQVVDPTPAQAEAGNYRKGHVDLDPFQVTIEQPKGTVRRSKDPKNPWESDTPADYGYIKGTKGKDGDPLDIFIGPKPENGKAFVIDQFDAKTGKFDEHKVVAGVDTMKEAEALYDSAYPTGRGPMQRLGGGTTEFTLASLADRLGERKTLGNRPLGKKQAKDYEDEAPATSPEEQAFRDQVAELEAKEKGVGTTDTPAESTTWRDNLVRSGRYGPGAGSGVDGRFWRVVKDDGGGFKAIRFPERQKEGERPSGELPSNFAAPKGTIWTPEEAADEAVRVAEWSAKHGRIPTAREWSEMGNPDGDMVAEAPGTTSAEWALLSDEERRKRAGVPQENAKVPGAGTANTTKSAKADTPSPAAKDWVYATPEQRRAAMLQARPRSSEEEVQDIVSRNDLRPLPLSFRGALEKALANPQGANSTEDNTPAETTGGPAKISPSIRDEIITALRVVLTGRREPVNINVVRKAAREIVPDLTNKEVEEFTEAAIVEMAIEIVQRPGLSDGEKYDALVALYKSQPLLVTRTSTSMADQAYSTPAPLAFLASRLADIDAETTVYEPTAGNGMLLIEAAPEKITANELNPERAANIERTYDINVHVGDGTKYSPPEKVDRVIANPPFGKVTNQTNQRRTYWDMDGRQTPEIDHAISWKALSSMKDDGRAVLIIGGKQGTDAERVKDYRQENVSAFFKKLYDQYNVTGHFTADGKLYQRQGAAWPVDVIVIEGRGKSALPYPMKQAPTIYGTWEALKEKLNDSVATGGERASGRGDSPAEPADLPADAGAVSAPADGTDRPADRGDGAGGSADAAGAGTGEGRAGPERQPQDGGPVDGGGVGRPDRGGGVPDRADSGEESDQRPGTRADAGGGEPGGVPVSGLPGPVDDIEAAFDEAFADVFGEPTPVPGAKRGPHDREAVIETGVVLRTKSGRETSPAPKIDATSDRNAKASIKRMNAWLLDEARKEAAGQDYLTTLLKAINPERMSQSDQDTVNDILFDDVDGATSEDVVRVEKPAGKVKPKAEPKTVTQAATGAITNTATAMDEVASGLFQLFGGPKVSSGISFDEETYAKAKPYFVRGAAAMRAAGDDIVAMMKALMRNLQEGFQFTAEMIQRMRPYITRFVADVKAGKVSLESQAETTTEAAPTKRAENQETETAYQVRYEPTSGAEFAVGTLVPNNMQTAIKKSLATLKERVGDIDDYVAKKLGYSRDELLGNKKKGISGYFSAEQVDALALAIDNVEAGGGFIIGDQTGVGKGRFVAAMIRYAMKAGKVPVFFTKQPGLYADMVRDLRAIGMGGIERRLWLTNTDLTGDQTIPLSGDDASDVLRSLPAKAQLETLATVTKTGRLPDGFDAIFTTYSQTNFKGGKRFARHDALEAVAPNALFILDESHLAGGSDARPEVDKKTGEIKPRRQDFVRSLLAASQGAVYSSATYAKNAFVMSLYFKTSLGAAMPAAGALENAIKSGGVPLQQVIANMLVEDGQYVRRERSFDGVEMNMEQLPTDRAKADRGAAALRTVFALDRDFMESVREGFIEDAGGEGETGGRDNAVGEESAGSTNFASIMHNVVSQLLMALKAEAIADKAIALHKAGEKPIIALSNTNESIIADFVDDMGINVGDPAPITFNRILERYLARLRRITLKDANGNKRYHYLSDDEIIEYGGEEALRAYEKAEREILRMDLSGLPASPIDYVMDRLRDAGIGVDEITGRTLTLPGGVLQQRKATDRAKKLTMNAYNSGKVDALVINKSGSTGFSLHATAEKGNDGKPRHMLFLQPDPNIDDFMQMLGRIHRTGQIKLPKYTLAVSDLAVEKRVAAVLMRKMASLNANTTGGKKSAVSLDAVDFMNRYGDQVVAEYLRENVGIARMVGVIPKDDNDGIAARFTGRLAIMPAKQVEEIYERIESAYTDHIEALERMGENTLEAKTLDLKAITKSSTEVTPARGMGVFDQASMAEDVSILRLGKALKPDEVRAEADEVVGDRTPVEYVDGIVAKLRDKLTPYKEAIAADIAEAETALENAKTEKQKDRAKGTIAALSQRSTELDADMAAIEADIRALAPGSTGTLSRLVEEGQPETFPAVVLDVDIRRVGKNPTARSTIVVHFAIADPGQRVAVPLSKLTGDAAKFSFAGNDGNVLGSRPELVTVYNRNGDAMEVGVNAIVTAQVRWNEPTIKGTIKAFDPAMGTFTIRNGDGTHTVPKYGIKDVIDTDSVAKWSSKPNAAAEATLQQFEEADSISREDRQIITGNLLAGFGKFTSGKFVFYTTESGEVKQGILMPKGFDAESRLAALSQSFNSADLAAKFIIDGPPAERMIKSSDGLMTATKSTGGEYIIRVQAAGGKPYMLLKAARDVIGDFEKARNGPLAKAGTYYADKFTKALKAYEENLGTQFVTDAHKDEAKALNATSTPGPKVAMKERPLSVRVNWQGDRQGTARPFGQRGAVPPGQRDVIREMVRDIVGPAVRVEYPDSIWVAGGTDTAKAWGEDSDGFEANGLYDFGERVIKIATTTVDRMHTARHEVGHALQSLYNDQERAVLKAELPRLRSFVVNHPSGWGEDMAGASAIEIEAEAAAMYLSDRETGRPSEGIHIAIRRVWERFYRFIRQVRNALNLRGFQTAEDIFERAARGEMRQRKATGWTKDQAAHLFGEESSVAQSLASRRRAPNGPQIQPASAPLATVAAPNPQPGPVAPSPQAAAVTQAANIQRMHHSLRSVRSTTDKVRVWMQDRFLAVRRDQERVEKAGILAVTNSTDTYRAESLFHGRAGEAVNDLYDGHVRKLMEFMREKGIQLHELDQYAYAMHAEERNIVIEERTRGTPLHTFEGSGMSVADSNAIIAAVNADARAADIKAAHRMLRKIINDSLDLEERSGLRTKEEADDLRAMYDHYVPLRGWESDPETGGHSRTGRGFDVRGRENMTAFGRASRADSPTAYAILQAQQAIIRAEKNRVLQTFYRYVQQVADPSLYERVKGEYKKRLNPQTGLVETDFDPTAPLRDDEVIALKVSGKRVLIKVHDEDMRVALQQLDSVRMNAALRIASKAARAFAMLQTQLNPNFLFSNFFRDVESALLNISDVKALPPGTRRKMLMSLPRIIWNIFRSLRNGQPTGKYGQAWDKFRLAGGKTSFIDFHDLDRIKGRLDRYAQPSRTDKVLDRSGVRALGKFISDLNDAVENGVRLAAFVALQEAGIDTTTSASVGRELTVNFNRRGTASPALNAAYVFFNASTQGITRTLQAIGRSRTVQVGVVSLVAAGFFNDMLNRWICEAFGGDDDERKAWDNLPNYVKERNFILMVPGTKGYIKIPLAFGYGWFFNSGRLMAAVANGKINPRKAATEFALSGLDAFNPMGTAVSPLQFISPTLMDPLVQVQENKNWTGAPIMPQKFDKAVPDSQLSYDSVAQYWVKVAETLNSWTGGSAGRPGEIDISPETFEHVAEFVIGGAGRNITDLWKTGARFWEGGEMLPEQIPMAKVLYGNAGTVQAQRNVFYEAWNDIEQAHHEQTVLKKDKDFATAKQQAITYRAELRAYEAFSRAQKTLQKLRRQKSAIRAKGLSMAEQNRAIDEIERQELATVSRAMALYARARGE